MNRERFERLVTLFKERKYFVTLRDLSIWTNICQYKPHKKKMNPVIKENRAYIRLVVDGHRYEYEMHEIISVWTGAFVLDMKCHFRDGNRLNYHPSNLYWHDKSINPAAQAGRKLSAKDVEEIRKAVCPKHVTKQKPLQDLADKYGISYDYASQLRSKNCKTWKNLKNKLK